MHGAGLRLRTGERAGCPFGLDGGDQGLGGAFAPRAHPHQNPALKNEDPGLQIVDLDPATAPVARCGSNGLQPGQHTDFEACQPLAAGAEARLDQRTRQSDHQPRMRRPRRQHPDDPIFARAVIALREAARRKLLPAPRGAQGRRPWQDKQPRPRGIDLDAHMGGLRRLCERLGDGLGVEHDAWRRRIARARRMQRVQADADALWFDAPPGDGEIKPHRRPHRR